MNAFFQVLLNGYQRESLKSDLLWDRSTLFVLAAFIGLGGVAFTAYAEQVPGLFVPAPVVRKTMVESTEDPGVIRSRPVQIHAASLPSADAAIGETISWNLFDDVVLTGYLEAKIRDDENSTTWTGGLNDEREGSFTLAIHNGTTLANIRSTRRGTFQLRVGRDGRSWVREVDESALPDCGSDSRTQIHPSWLAATASGAAPATATRTIFRIDDTVIDVLVFYTPAARDGAGG